MADNTEPNDADKPKPPSALERYRERYPWLDHLVRAGAQFTTSHGDHYAAAITYFSILALVPLLMVGFAAVALVLRANPELLDQLQVSIAKSAPPGLDKTLNPVITQAVKSGTTVGVIGLLGALYSGLGWMTNLREALSQQWGQREDPPPFPRRLAVDLAALIGLGLALGISVAVAAGGGLAGQILEYVGLGDIGWLRPAIRLLVVIFGLLANALVFLWVIARLPRAPVTWRSAAKAALVGAVGMELIKQVMVVYIAKITDSPAGAAFGPIIGLLIFVFTVSRFILFLAAWAATAKENMVEERPVAPGPAVIRPEVTVRGGAGPGAAAGLVGAGAVAGLVGVSLIRRRKG
ncbi:MAG TPA: inner membrane protein YhjD [Pseudonocardia sp.]